jgi:hypothetical protein
MTAKQTADIAESLEKLGFDIISIIEEKEIPEFKPKLIQITLGYIGEKPKKLK